MASRSRSRQRALQVLYQWDMRKLPVEDCLAAYYGSLFSEREREAPERDEFMEQLVKGVAASSADLDSRIVRHSENWRLERMSPVDRNILRLAAYEMLHLGGAPPVVIDQALILARQFSGDESVAFVNAVLDALRREAAGANTTPEVNL